MADQADGSIIIDTEINSDGFKAGSAELLAAIKALSTEVKNLGQTLKELFSKPLTPEINTGGAEDKVAALEAKVQELQASLEELQNTNGSGAPAPETATPQVNIGGVTERASGLQREIDAVNSSVQKLEPTFQKAMSGSESAMTSFESKSCPGSWMYARMGDLAEKVTAELGTTEDTVKPSVPDTGSATVKKGDTVRILSGATYYNGKAVPNWVAAKQWIVREVSGDRAVIDKSVDGKNSICSPINVKFLSVVSGAATPTPSFSAYRVKVTADALNIRKGPGTGYGTNGCIRDHGVYTIVAESTGTGATKWGKLKSGAGWISLDYAKKV